MTTENDEFRKGLVAAVQAELERHASAVVAEVDRLREESQREREALRNEFRESLTQIVGSVEQGQARAESQTTKTREQLEQRLEESEARQTRRLDDSSAGLEGAVAEAVRPVVGELRDGYDAMSRVVAAVEQGQTRAELQSIKTREQLERRLEESEARQTRRLDDSSAGLEGAVAEAVRPVVGELRDDYEAMSHKVDGLDSNLRKFDEQAARMVTYFNDVSSTMEAKQDELSETLKTDVASQIDGLKKLVEDNDSSIRRFQNEVGQSVSAKVNDAEDRFNNRLLAAESRMKEDAGSKIADIQAEVGRMNTGLDETMTILNDRVAKLDDRFVESDRRMDGLAAEVEGIDQDALEELKDKLSSAAGEAMLVRIEMERMEKSVSETTDGLTVRMTDVETQLQDATMDVSTAVQLDRLEEIERALIELPNVFVQRDGSATPGGSGTGEGAKKSVKNDDSFADESSGFDPSAILSAEQSRQDDHR